MSVYQLKFNYVFHLDHQLVVGAYLSGDIELQHLLKHPRKEGNCYD